MTSLGQAKSRGYFLPQEFKLDPDLKQTDSKMYILIYTNITYTTW